MADPLPALPCLHAPRPPSGWSAVREPPGRMTVGCVPQPPFLGRTLLPVLLLAASARCHWPSEPAEVVRDWENQLEASMHSVLSDLRETVPAVVGIPDSSAVVGRFFRVSIPTDLIASNGEAVQVRNVVPRGSLAVVCGVTTRTQAGCCGAPLRLRRAVEEGCRSFSPYSKFLSSVVRQRRPVSGLLAAFRLQSTQPLGRWACSWGDAASGLGQLETETAAVTLGEPASLW